MKHEWRKKEKSLYIPKEKPEILDVESFNYITLKGMGNPNSESFKDAIGALYAVSYAIRMAPKAGHIIENYYEYTVYPLEGVWSLTNKGIDLLLQGKKIYEIKDHFSYKLMIRQPNFITKQCFSKFQELAYNKRKNKEILKIRFKNIKEGLSCQMLHIGSYDNEDLTIKEMEAYCSENGYKRVNNDHKEIYLSDARRVSKDKLRTTLRFQIKKI